MYGRRALLTLLAGLGMPALAGRAAQAQATEAGEIRPVRPVRRPQRPVPPRPPTPPVAETREVRPAPAIDRPALQPLGPGPQPAPVPFANAQPPLVDRQPRPSIAFGVPTPPVFGQGETFARPDSINETTRAQQGARLPSPGATLRLPMW